MNNKNSLYRNLPFLSVLAYNFFYQLGQQMMNTLIPKFANTLVNSSFLVGFATSIFAVSSILIRPVAAPAIDSFSKKKLLLGSMLGIITVYFGLSFSKSIRAVLLLRLLHGACVGCATPLCLALVASTLSPQDTGKGIGLFTLCQAVGQAVGPKIGLSLLETYSYSTSFMVGGFMMVFSTIVALFIQEPQTKRSPYRVSLQGFFDKDSLDSAILMFMLQIVYCCISSFIVIYAELRGVGNIGLYFTVYALCLLAVKPVNGYLIDKFGYGKILIIGFLSYAVALATISFATNLSIFLVAAVIAALGYGICQPTIMYLCIRSVPSEKFGVASSTNYLGSDVGFLVGASFAGMLADKLRIWGGLSEMNAYSKMFLLMTIPMFVAVIYFLLIKDSLNRKIDNNTAQMEARNENNT
ncbi:MAG: MFS transporter [Anaerolineaceae bacterium]|nr:MFS transporter [Anaerolineaceae bacterium]